MTYSRADMENNLRQVKSPIFIQQWRSFLRIYRFSTPKLFIKIIRADLFNLTSSISYTSFFPYIRFLKERPVMSGPSLLAMPRAERLTSHDFISLFTFSFSLMQNLSSFNALNFAFALKKEQSKALQREVNVSEKT